MVTGRVVEYVRCSVSHAVSKKIITSRVTIVKYSPRYRENFSLSQHPINKVSCSCQPAE